MARPDSTHRRLRAIGDELAGLRVRVRELDEQLAFQRGALDDIATHAAVTDHVFTDLEHERAAGDLRRTQRERGELADLVASLLAEQDALLERLYDDASTGGAA